MNPFFQGLADPLPMDTTVEELVEAKKTGRLDSLDRRMQEYIQSRLDHDYCNSCDVSSNPEAADKPAELHLDVNMDDESTCTASEDEQSSSDQQSVSDRYTFENAFAKPDSTVDTPEDSSQDSDISTLVKSDADESSSDEADSDASTDAAEDDRYRARMSPANKRKRNKYRSSLDESRSVSSSADSSAGRSDRKTIRVFNAIAGNSNVVCSQSDSEHPDLRTLARLAMRKPAFVSFQGSNQITAMGAIRATMAVVPTPM
jgi:hypothetical protein